MSARKRRADKLSVARVEAPVKVPAKTLAEMTARDFSQDPRPKLRHYFSNLSQGGFPSGLHVLVYTRELLEYLNQASKHPTANLYGNWSVHTRIHLSASGYQMLVKINHHIASVTSQNAPSDPQWSGVFNRGIIDTLATAALRRELKALYREHAVPAPFLDSYSLWMDLLANMWGEFRAKPIQWPGPKSDKWTPALRHRYNSARAAIEKAHGSTKMFVNHFMLDLVPTKEDPTGGTLRWMCITEALVRLEGAVSREHVEPREAFEND